MGLVGCSASSSFREDSPNRKWVFELKNDPNQVQDQSRFLLYVHAANQPAGDPVGRIRYTNNSDVPRKPVIKWLDDKTIEIRMLPDHSFTIPPSVQLKDGDTEHEVKFLFVYPKE